MTETDVVCNGPVMCPEAILRWEMAWLNVTFTSTRTIAPRTWAGFKSGTAVFSTCTNTLTCLTTLLPATMVPVSKIVALSKDPSLRRVTNLTCNLLRPFLHPRDFAGRSPLDGDFSIFVYGHLISRLLDLQ